MAAAETIALDDGRALCFARYGARGGKPVISLHGAGSSRIEAEVYDEAARAAGLEIFAPDRPGCGGSSPPPVRSYLEYAPDLQQLADQLGLRRFVVAGMSNGGAYALAAATRLGDRVVSAVLINSVTPIRDPDARRVSGFSVRLAYGLMKFRWMVRFALKNNLRAIASPLTGDWLRRNLLESLRQPDVGYYEEEMRIASSDWGFDHTAIQQPVEFVTGDRDGNFNFAPIWARRLPRARSHVFPGGHPDFATPVAVDKIIAAMAEHAS